VSNLAWFGFVLSLALQASLQALASQMAVQSHQWIPEMLQAMLQRQAK
jgi:hypothetical protein